MHLHWMPFAACATIPVAACRHFCAMCPSAPACCIGITLYPRFGNQFHGFPQHFLGLTTNCMVFLDISLVCKQIPRPAQHLCSTRHMRNGGELQSMQGTLDIGLYVHSKINTNVAERGEVAVWWPDASPLKHHSPCLHLCDLTLLATHGRCTHRPAS